MPPLDPSLDPRLMAGVELLRRTGTMQFQLRYSDDEQPVVWMAVGMWLYNAAGMPAADGTEPRHEVAAALDPVKAVMRLCEAAMDGGECQHCHRPSGISDDWTMTLPLDDFVCWYQFDPELQTFRRGCEGERSRDD